jgi:lipoyl(octanoyl) transferase
MSGASQCRLIVDPPAGGAWNMAVDEALLLAAAEENVATLRFYEWKEPTLSLGYFQRYDERAQHAASRDCSVVRRQSGGGAILHDRELTYSLTLPGKHPLARDAQQLYAAIHESIIRQLNCLSSGSGGKWALAMFCPVLPKSVSKTCQLAEPFLCFQRRAPGDVILTPLAAAESAQTTPNYKIVGSAQRRHRGAILQHGSILLARSPAAPELSGFCDLAGVTMTASTLTSILSTALGQVLGTRVELGDLPATFIEAARKIERDKYASESWMHRR